MNQQKRFRNIGAILFYAGCITLIVFAFSIDWRVGLGVLSVLLFLLGYGAYACAKEVERDQH
jgi:hypothetical protein